MKDHRTENIELALKWLQNNDIQCYSDGGSIYVQIADTDVELSSAEIVYRAGLQEEIDND